MKATERYVIFSRKLEISACFNNQQGKVYIFIYLFTCFLQVLHVNT